jgi:hypothetical protein
MFRAHMRQLRQQTILALAASLLIQPALTGLSKAQSVRTEGIPAPSPEKAIGSLLSDDSSNQEALLSRTDYKSANREQNGFISGTVLDQTGAVSVGANVRLSHEGEDSARQMQSGNNGQFLFTNVAPGPFRLTVTAPGFAIREFSAALHANETFLVPPITLSILTAVTEVHVKDSPLATVELADMQIGEQTKQRVLGIFPNFYVSYERDAVPLNPKQKFRLASKTTSDPFTFVGVAALAGIEQATNAFDRYGQGAQGYFKRFGASYIDAITATYIGSAILPSVLKQDPRYFYKGTGSKRSRLLYALASPFICKGDDTRWQPNYSNVGGAFASGGISYLYYPETNHKGAGLVFQTALIRLSEMSFEGILQEFLIRRLTPRLRKRASDQR